MLMAWGDNVPNKRLKSDGYVVHTTQGLKIALMPFNTDLGWWWDAEVESGVSMTFNLCGLWNKTAADEFYYSDFHHTTEGDGVARLTAPCWKLCLYIAGLRSRSCALWILISLFRGDSFVVLVVDYNAAVFDHSSVTHGF